MNNYLDREHAVVIGSGIGGMVCARVLCEHFSRVTIVEKDLLPKSPATRKSVPQGHFLHILLAKGLQVLDQLFPELLPSLEKDGAVKFNVGEDVSAKMSHGWIPKYKSDIWLYGCSRPLLEWHIHKQLAANGKINILERSEVVSLLYDQENNNVSGVSFQQNDVRKELLADIVVDASGRASKTIKLLEEIGFKKPDQTIVQPPVVYSCRAFKKPANFQADWKLLAVYPDEAKSSSGGFVNPIENDQWMVTLWGVGKALSRDDSLFLEFARSLPSPDIYNAIKEAEPLSPVYSHRKTISRINHFEKLKDRPEQFFTLGDTVCSYNPVYGQGMTSAVLGAVALGELLSSHPKGSKNLAEKFQKKLAGVNSQIWQRGTLDDLRWSETTSENEILKKEIAVRTKYMERIWRLAIHDTQIAELLWSVMHFLKPINELTTLDVQNRLARFEEKKTNTGIWHARVDSSTLTKKNIGEAVSTSKLDELAKVWVQGGAVNWQNLHQGKTLQRLHLPTYPFEKEKFSISKAQKSNAFSKAKSFNYIHPLLHENISDFFEQRFSSSFVGDEFFLCDHQVNGKKILPGVGLLEMARIAMEKASGSQKNGNAIQFTNVAWSQSITVNDCPKEIRIRLSAKDISQIQYEVYGEAENDDESIVYSQGIACINMREEASTIDIDAIRSQMKRGILSAADCYKAFKTMGVEYGVGYQGIQEIYQGENQLLAKLYLPLSLQNTQNDYVLHPSLVDCALQSSIGLMFLSEGKATDVNGEVPFRPSQPFALESLDIIDSLTADMYAWARYSTDNKPSDNTQKMDIDLCDINGNICVKIKGVCYKKEVKVPEESLENKLGISFTEIKANPEPIALTAREKVELLLKLEISVQLNQPINTVETTRGYFELGLDSLGFLMLIEKIQNVIKEKLPPEKLFEYVTIEQLSNYLSQEYSEQFELWAAPELKAEESEIEIKEAKDNESEDKAFKSKGAVSSHASSEFSHSYRRFLEPSSKPQEKRLVDQVSTTSSNFPELVHLNKKSQGRPVFWIHGGIGGVQPYYYIAEGIQRPFYGIQAKGKIRTSSSGMKSVASYYIRIMKSIQPEGPYDLGGYSLGGLISYEITRQLQEQGDTVSSIVMLDTLDTSGLEKIRNSVRSQQLLYVNLTLASRVMQDPGMFTKTLIHQNVLDESLEPHLFLEHLVDLAAKKGLVSKAQLKEKVAEMAGEEEDYSVDLYSLAPLPYPGAVKCYYFRNKSGLFFGELEPYFIVSSDKSLVDNTNYWGQWQKNILDFHIMDVDTPNHMNFLLEPKVYKTITNFCISLYSEKGMTEAFLESFKQNLNENHGVIKDKEEEYLNSGLISRFFSNMTKRKNKVGIDPA